MPRHSSAIKRQIYRCNHGNRRRLTAAAVATRRASNTSRALAPPTVEHPQRHEPPSLPISASSSSSSSMASRRSSPRLIEDALEMPTQSRRNSFEDFATLDSVIFEMSEVVQKMTKILQNAGAHFVPPSTSSAQSSIEQAVALAPTFQSIQPLMLQLQSEIEKSNRLFTPPPLPSDHLLLETAELLAGEHGDDSFHHRLVIVNEPTPTTWPLMNSVFRIFSIADRQVMTYMRHLKEQTPSALPTFPPHLHLANTYIITTATGAFFFGEGGFVCAAPTPTQRKSPSTTTTTSSSPLSPSMMTRQLEDKSSEVTFWYEASDTDDDFSSND